MKSRTSKNWRRLARREPDRVAGCSENNFDEASVFGQQMLARLWHFLATWTPFFKSPRAKPLIVN
jgi:hypothetical protein